MFAIPFIVLELLESESGTLEGWADAIIIIKGLLTVSLHYSWLTDLVREI